MALSLGAGDVVSPNRTRPSPFKERVACQSNEHVEKASNLTDTLANQRDTTYARWKQQGFAPLPLAEQYESQSSVIELGKTYSSG